MNLTIATLDPKLQFILREAGWVPSLHVGSMIEFRWSVAMRGWPEEPRGLGIELGNRSRL